MTKTTNVSGAFVAASWAGLVIGVAGTLIGLWNADSLKASEKGFYLAVLLLGLYSGVSLQKAVRDRLEGIRVTSIYYGLSWAALASAIALLVVGLFNAELLLSEKGFFGMAFALAMFASIAVQKNIRDRGDEPPATSRPEANDVSAVDAHFGG